MAKKATEFVSLLSLLVVSFFSSAASRDSKNTAIDAVPVYPPSTVSSGTNQYYTNTWCIAKPSTDDEALQDIIRYCCVEIGVDCTPIQPTGSCYNPTNLVSQASYVMNLYYKTAGKNPWNCYFKGSALTIDQDPSCGTCKYEL